MFKSKSTKYVASFLISWLGLYLVFPHIPGITYTGSLFGALGLTIVNLLVITGIIVVAVIVGIVGALAWLVKHDKFKNFKKSDVTAWMIKLGFWKLTIGGSVIGILLSSLSWKITASLSSSLVIHGWLPIIIGTTITSLIAFVPKYLSRPDNFTEEHFRVELNATLAKEQAEEAAEEGHDHKDGETK
jgi:hypothetical protein